MAELVGGRGARAIEDQAEDPLIRRSAGGERVGRHEQQTKTRRTGLLGGHRGVKGDRERLAEEIVGDRELPPRGPVLPNVKREVGRIVVSRRHFLSMPRIREVGPTRSPSLATAPLPSRSDKSASSGH